MPDELKNADEEVRKAWAISQTFQQPIMVKTIDMLEELGIKTYTMDSFQVADGIYELETKQE